MAQSGPSDRLAERLWQAGMASVFRLAARIRPGSGPQADADPGRDIDSQGEVHTRVLTLVRQLKEINRRGRLRQTPVDEHAIAEDLSRLGNVAEELGEAVVQLSARSEEL